ncbi:MAG: hypothetical protein ACR2NU_06075 [Aeoliella sp.]
MQEAKTIARKVSTEELFNDLRYDFPKHDVSLKRFGWIAVNVSVDVTVRLKVRKDRVTIYARRRIAPGILGALFSGLAGQYAELELTRELRFEQKRFAEWTVSKYGAPYLRKSRK